MTKNTMSYKAALLCCALMTPSLAMAQAKVPDAQTGVASPGRVGEQLRDSGIVSDNEVHTIKDSDVLVQGAPEGAENIKFTLRDLRVSGNKSLTVAEIEGAYAGLVGEQISLFTIYEVAAELTRQYRNKGFALTQVVVPPQTIENGIVRLQVVEGFIDSIEVLPEDGTEEDQGLLDLVNRRLARIQSEGNALDVGDLEHIMLLINDLPGVSARGVLRPSTTQTGAAGLLVFVERDAFEGVAAIDNYGSRFLGPVQASIAASVNSLLGFNERITGQFVYAPDRDFDTELYYAGLTYDQPIFDHGTVVSVFGSQTRTDPGFTLDEFDVEGKSFYTGATISHPFVRSRETNFSMRFTLDYRNVESSNNLENRREDDIRAARIGARFEKLESWFGTAYNVLDIQLSQGLDIFGASDENNPNKSRAIAKPEFTKLEAEFQRLQRLGYGLNLLLGARGQWANDALLSSEEFGVGGQNYGRGYDSSEITGDDGFAGKAEIQWNNPFSESYEYLESHQLYVFYDAGRTFNTDPVTNATKTDTLTSTGFGVRTSFVNEIDASLLVAFPLNRDVQTMGDEDPRLFFRLSKEF